MNTRSFGLVNFDRGEELPNPIDTTRLEQVPYLVMRIGEVLAHIYQYMELKGSVVHPVYCIKIRIEYINSLVCMVTDIEREGLPKGCYFYDTDGRKVFELRGPSGGVVTAAACYIYAK